MVGTAGALALVLAGIGLGLGSLDDGSEPISPPAPNPATAPAPIPAPPQPDKAQERAGPPAVLLQPAQAIELEPPYLILDGLTFTAGPTTLRLGGLEGPSARATCRNQEGYAWACGLQARAALNNALRTRKAVCTPTDVATNGVPHATCSVEGADLGQKLVAEGWARPLASDASSPAQALEDARANGRGLWNGDWTVMEPGPAQDVSADLRRGMDGLPAETGN
jgi:endonuclease YncB( thermonuclease family)